MNPALDTDHSRLACTASVHKVRTALVRKGHMDLEYCMDCMDQMFCPKANKELADNLADS
jgi:hypothetical protein